MIAWIKRILGITKREGPVRPDEAQQYIDACKAAGHVVDAKAVYDIAVLGIETKAGHPHMCRECVEKSLNQFSTICDACGCVIMPGMAVAISCRKPEFSKGHKYTCMGWDCCFSGIAYCGVWGMGRLVTLNELSPEKYAPGCAHLGDAVINGPPDQVTIINDFNAP